MVISAEDAQRQFAFVKGNRPVNTKIVKQKEKSMKAYGQLTPITVTDGEKVIQMGGRLVDLGGNEIPNENAENFIRRIGRSAPFDRLSEFGVGFE